MKKPKKRQAQSDNEVNTQPRAMNINLLSIRTFFRPKVEINGTGTPPKKRSKVKDSASSRKCKEVASVEVKDEVKKGSYS